MDNQDSVLLDISPTEIGGEKKANVMHFYKIIRNFSNACHQKNISQIEKLQTNIALKTIETLQTVNENTLSDPETRNEFRNDVIESLLSQAYNESIADNFELLFFASAKFEIIKLREIIEGFKTEPITYPDNINQTRYSDSVIIFVLKYGNINNENFYECMKILIEADVDINKCDIKGNTPIDYIAILYEHNKDKQNLSKTLRDIAQLFLDKGICKCDNKKTKDFLSKVIQIEVEGYNFAPMNDKNLLFYWISKNKTKEFLAFKEIKNYVDSDNGENTLLQFASKKTDNMLPVVQFLLKNGADPNKRTNLNPLTPLELAAVYNHQKIFEEILKNEKTEIKQKHFNNFVRWRLEPMKAKLFELLLESNKLNPSFTYDKTGNTPLHYAIIFSHKKAIHNLLKLHSSLMVKNKFDLCALDIIDSEHLEKYFDSCLALDNYTNHFSDYNHKMQFRFNCLIDDYLSEDTIISKIGKDARLEHLLTHPFIHTFITLKWFKIKFHFWIILFSQALIFLLMSLLFYRLPTASSLEFCFCVLFALVNAILKAPIFLYFNINTENRRPEFFVLERAALHGIFEFLLVITIIGSFFQDQFRAFIFVEMAIPFLLTAGYHPRLSKWSVMLQQVFKTFAILLLFFSLIVVAFSLGFHILFPNNAFFRNFFGAIFRTYIMTTGEFNLEDETGFDAAGFGGYLLFLLFAMGVALVIVNFWIGVAVSDIERIEKDSEINASKNVMIFMLFIDHIYSFNLLKKMRKLFPNPLLFLRVNENGFIYHDSEKFEVDFYVNKEKQFEENTGFPSKVDNECFNKIRCHYYKLAKVSSEKQILLKFDELAKMLTEIKSKCFRSN